MLGELPQTVGEHVRARARQGAAQVGEPPRAEPQLADDEQRPPFTDDVKRARQRARVGVAAAGGHRTKIQ